MWDNRYEVSFFIWAVRFGRTFPDSLLVSPAWPTNFWWQASSDGFTPWHCKLTSCHNARRIPETHFCIRTAKVGNTRNWGQEVLRHHKVKGQKRIRKLAPRVPIWGCLLDGVLLGSGLQNLWGADLWKGECPAPAKPAFPLPSSPT